MLSCPPEPRLNLPRRTLLTAGAALGLAGAAGLALAPSEAPQLDPPRRATLQRLCEVILVCEAERAAAAVERFAQVLVGFEPALQAQVIEAIDALASRPLHLLLEGEAAPFDQLSDAQVEERLGQWASSSLPLRQQAFTALRALINAVAWGHADFQADCGYPGPPDLGQAQAPPPPGREG